MHCSWARPLPAGPALETLAPAVHYSANIAQKRREQKAAKATHDWVTWQGITRCQKCLITRSNRVQACSGAANKFQQVAGDALRNGHSLWVAEAVLPVGLAPGLPFAACIKCGGWATVGRSQLMSEPCLPPSKHGAYAIRRMRRGLFPRAERRWTGMTLSQAMPLDGGLG